MINDLIIVLLLGLARLSLIRYKMGFCVQGFQLTGPSFFKEMMTEFNGIVYTVK